MYCKALWPERPILCSHPVMLRLLQELSEHQEHGNTGLCVPATAAIHQGGDSYSHRDRWGTATHALKSASS